MATKILSAVIIGLDAKPVEVEADISQGLPNFVIVGLPDASVQESRERVRAAIRNTGIPFPRTRLTVNLAPADIRKEGPAYDLPIAVAILEASGALPAAANSKRLYIGEVALDGALRPISGVLPAAIMAVEHGFEELYVPAANAEEASLVDGIKVMPVRNIEELIQHLQGGGIIIPHERKERTTTAVQVGTDFSEIRGQSYAKRALEIAAAGGHNVLFSGPPGAGKTLLARAMPGILPPMTREESLEVTKIASVAGLLTGGGIITNRPFRAPHHTASGAALIGGGSWPRPGEVSLAHRGVLFLDELPEFPRAVLENLRQPLEDGSVTVVRANSSATFPSKFMLVAARNPCPCGYASDPDMSCSCPPSRISSYGRKISGPILDRIDLHVEVPRMRAEEMLSATQEECSDAVRKRVTLARAQQYQRLSSLGLHTNSEMSHSLLRKLCPLDAEGEKILRSAIARLMLSARAVTRTLRLARTIADLDGSDSIRATHLAEAVQYREINRAII